MSGPAPAATADTKGVTQVAKNLFKPLTSATMGAAEYVLLEVCVGKVLRRFINAPRGWIDLAVCHTVSLPLIGGLSQFFEAQKDIFAKAGTDDAGWTQQLGDGAKAVPAIYAAEYIVNTFTGGIHMPKPALKDAGITLVGKAITRPIAAMILPYLPDTMAESYHVLDKLIKRQWDASKKTTPAAVPGR